MIFNNIKESIITKTVSLVLVFAFSMVNTSYASTEKDALAPTSIISSEMPLSVDDVGIAIDAGTIKSSFSGSAGKMVIHIQDAHCNFEAQSNINKMLDQLTKECSIDVISVEGAEGIVDTAWFKAFPDAEIRKEVATYFMKKGEITGAEFFSINSDYNGTIFGAETKDYYVKNLRAFTEVYPHKTMIENYFKNTRSVATRLKSIVYTPKLKELDSKIRAFSGKELELSEYAEYLYKASGKSKIVTANYPNFKKLIETLEYEDKIDFDIVDSERSKYIDFLAKKLTKEEMTELVTQSIKFKKGHIKAVDFYSFLRNLAKTHNIQMLQDYPNLFYYYIYTKIYDGIDNEGLFSEIDQVERALKDKLFIDDTQRKLDRYSELVDMFIDLANIELTNEDYDLFKEYSEEFSITDVITFYSSLVDKYNLNYAIDGVSLQVSDNIPKMIAFYEIAMKRDQALIENTLKYMESGNSDRCVLIAGGFHTRGIKNILEGKGISYVVVTPKITKDVETPYIKVLTNQRTSLEDIITESAAMPGTATSKSEERMTESVSDLLSPLYRFGYGITMYINPEQREALRKLSEEMGTVEGLPDFYGATVSTFEEAVGILTAEWLKDIKANMVKELGMTEDEAIAEFNKFVKDDNLWKMLQAVYLGKYDDYFAGTEAKTPPSEAVRGRIKEAFRKFRQMSSGPEHIRLGVDDAYSLEEARSINSAIADTIAEMQEMVLDFDIEVDNPATGGTFVVLEDLIFDEMLKKYGAPFDIEAHPGTRLTRLDYASGAIRYSEVAKRYYIRQSTFELLTDSEKDTFARHEEMHIKIALGIIPRSEVEKYETEEAYVNHQPGADIRTIMARLGSVGHMESILMEDTEFGTAVRDHIENERVEIKEMIESGNPDQIELANADQEALEKWIKAAYTIRVNIDHMRNLLTQEHYTGYDINIISSSTPDEADYQKKVLEKLFAGRDTDNDDMKNKVCILSVLDEAEGGQIIGQGNTWRRAVDQFKEWAEDNGLENTSLEDLFNKDKVKIAIYHNGGKGERASPATQALGNSRGAQKLVGKVTNAEGEEMDLELIAAVVMETAPLAMSNDKSRIDTFWANQVAFGTIDFASLERSNYHFDKFVIKIPGDPQKKDLFDYGTAIIDSAGKIVKFLANRVLTWKDEVTGKYVDNPEFAKELGELKAAPKGVFDYGSFSMSRDMHYAVMGYWTDVKGIFKVIDESEDKKAGMSRDIDPAFVQVIVPLVNGLTDKQLPQELLNREAFAAMPYSAKKEEMLEKAYQTIIGIIDQEDFVKAIDKIYNKKKKDQETGEMVLDVESRRGVYETIDFFLINRETLFVDLDKVVGSIDMGENSHWFAYKRMLDLSNEKFFMLADLIGTTQELDTTGEIITTEATLPDIIKAEDSRRVKNIKNDAITVFYTEDGEKITLTAKQMKEGYHDREKDIVVEGSIIQGFTVLKPGSKVINSVVNDSVGKITAVNSYVESSTSPEIDATNSIVFKAADENSIIADKEIIADAYRPVIKDVRFQDGQTRMRAPIGYDPKGAVENDKTRFGDNIFSFQKIRDLLVNRPINDAIEAKNRLLAFFKTIDRQKWVKRFKEIGFGTSGLRDTILNLTDMEVSINAKGYLKFLIEQNLLDKEGVNTFTIAMDRRPSSPRIANAIAKALEIEAAEQGYKIALDFAGKVPSPAAALRGQNKKSFTVIVTGSHIPFDMNGIKFYLADGEEVLKEHEPLILNAVKDARKEEYTKSWQESLYDELGMFKEPVSYPVRENEAEVLQEYKERYLNGFPAGLLTGDSIVFWQHSAVGRDIIDETYTEQGANVIKEERSDTFVPVDTEKIKPEMDTKLKNFAAKHKKEKPIGVVFTDGDSDRPGVADENGNFVTGDKLGLLVTKELLKAVPDDEQLVVALPVSTNYGVINELKSLTDSKGNRRIKLVKTSIGSPHVVKAMNDAAALAGKKVYALGWEANGGFLLGSAFKIKGAEAPLTRLATRDAVIAILATIKLAKDQNLKLSELFEKEIPKVYNHTGGYEGLLTPKEEGGFGLEREAGMKVRGKIIEMLTPKLNDKKTVSIDFEENKVERRKEAIINKKKVTLFETESVDISAGDKDMAEWNRVKGALEEVFTAERGFAKIKGINILDGIQVIFKNDEISHLRPSGNDPVFRNYAMSDVSQDRAKEIAALGEKEIIPELARKVLGIEIPEGETEVTSPGTKAVRRGTYEAPENLTEVLRVPLVDLEKVKESKGKEYDKLTILEKAKLIEREKGRLINVVFMEDDKGNLTVYDEVEVYPNHEAVDMPEVLRGRKQQATVADGSVEFSARKMVDETLLPTTIDWTADKDSTYDIPEDEAYYTMRNSGEERASTNIRYENIEREQRVYGILNMVMKHISAIIAQKTIVYVPIEMFYGGTKGTGVGSFNWTEEVIKEITGNKVELKYYNASNGLEDLGGMGLETGEGVVNVLVAANDHLENKDQLAYDGVEDFIKQVRPLPVPIKALNLGSSGWDFSLETVGWALILGAVKPETIKDRQDLTSPASDMVKFMERILQKEVKREYLYTMMPYSELANFSGDITDEEVKSALAAGTLISWLSLLIDKLLFDMPPEPFDPADQLRQRMKIMWSV